jgi:hypothetical protein
MIQLNLTNLVYDKYYKKYITKTLDVLFSNDIIFKLNNLFYAS